MLTSGASIVRVVIEGVGEIGRLVVNPVSSAVGHHLERPRSAIRSGQGGAERLPDQVAHGRAELGGPLLRPFEEVVVQGDRRAHSRSIMMRIEMRKTLWNVPSGPLHS